MDINRDYSPGSIQTPAPIQLPKGPDGMSVKQLPKPPNSSPSVRGTASQRPPPPVPIRTTAKLTKTELEDKRKVMKDHRDMAKAEAFKTGGRVGNKMESLAKYHAMQKDLAHNKADLKAKTKETATTNESRWHSVKKTLGKAKTGISRLGSSGRESSLGCNFVMAGFSGVLDTVDVVSSAKNLRSDILDTNKCKTLIAEGQARLKDPNISPKERRDIENGIKMLNEHIEKKTPTAKQVTKVVMSATSAVHSVASFTYGVSKIAAAVSTTIQGVPVIGQVAAVVTLPLGAALCFDAVWSIKNNLKQVSQDRDSIGKSSEKLAKAYDKELRLDDISGQLDKTSAPPALKNQIKTLAGEVNTAQATIKSADQKLLAGNLKKPEIAALKKQKLEAQTRLQNSMGVAINLMSTHVGAHPDIRPVLNKAHAKQIIGSSANNLEQTINPYLNQRLQTKRIGEWVKGAGEMMALTATGLGAAGLVATVAGGGAGAPLLVAAAVMGIASTATIYGGGLLVNKFRKMQLGKDRVKTDQFDAAMMGQLEKEVKNWDVLKGAGMEGNTTAAAMFEVVKKHYGGMPKDWGPKEWAQSLVNDAPKGPERKRFKEAMGVMLYHDSTKGIIGGITNKAVGAVEKKLDKRAAAKAAA
ncbi:MAG: hypothetical protein Q8K75_07745 [Chlamydiales bacterium]|nr:hypothetical protein [Chlamydiales bacterium]